MKEMLELDIKLLDKEIDFCKEQIEKYKSEGWSDKSIGYVEGRLDGARQQKKLLEQYLKEVDNG